MMFQDTMDSQRVVKPVKMTGKEWDCQVFWKDGGSLRYGGMAKIPASLFDESNPRNERIGFVPYGKQAETAP